MLFTPADFAALTGRDLARTVCVVFDVLRATSSMVTALAHGAEAIVPVAEIPEAVVRRQQRPDVLLAGERHGLRIRADRAGGAEFDLGNSPREFSAATVRGKTIVMSTTNGTRALRACAGASVVLVSCWLNLQATVDCLKARAPGHLILVCSGTFEEAALEDALAAGAVAESLWPQFATGHISDAAVIARQLYRTLGKDLANAMRLARNGQRLLGNPDLRADVAVCLQRDTMPLVAGLGAEGAVRRLFDT